MDIEDLQGKILPLDLPYGYGWFLHRKGDHEPIGLIEMEFSMNFYLNTYILSGNKVYGTKENMFSIPSLHHYKLNLALMDYWETFADVKGLTEEDKTISKVKLGNVIPGSHTDYIHGSIENDVVILNELGTYKGEPVYEVYCLLDNDDTTYILVSDRKRNYFIPLTDKIRSVIDNDLDSIIKIYTEKYEQDNIVSIF